jgi:hypothetical protein
MISFSTRYLTMQPYINFIAIILFFQTSALGQSHVDSNFIKSRGTWISPIDKIVKIDTMGPCYYPCDLPRGLIIETDSNRIVRSVQPGQVAMVTFIGDAYAVIVRNNDYFITYSALKSTSHKKGDYVKTGQEIGILTDGNDGVYELELILSYGDKEDHRIQDWFSEDFRRKARFGK